MNKFQISPKIFLSSSKGMWRGVNNEIFDEFTRRKRRVFFLSIKNDQCRLMFLLQKDQE
jgi:hypothetical protein